MILDHLEHRCAKIRDFDSFLFDFVAIKHNIFLVLFFKKIRHVTSRDEARFGGHHVT